jgi:hypothetical protein
LNEDYLFHKYHISCSVYVTRKISLFKKPKRKICSYALGIGFLGTFSLSGRTSNL